MLVVGTINEETNPDQLEGNYVWLSVDEKILLLAGMSEVYTDILLLDLVLLIIRKIV